MRVHESCIREEEHWKCPSINIYIPFIQCFLLHDFCLDDATSTLREGNTYGDGWQTKTGCTMTVDLGEKEIDIMEMNSGIKEHYEPIERDVRRAIHSFNSTKSNP